MVKQTVFHKEVNQTIELPYQMDFVAEIVLGYADLLLSEKLSILKIKDYKILRFRDDYRIFTNNSLEAEQITKELSETLSELGLKLNADKTEASHDIMKHLMILLKAPLNQTKDIGLVIEELLRVSKNGSSSCICYQKSFLTLERLILSWENSWKF